AGHRAADAHAADVRAAADTVHPTALRYIAIDDRAPAALLHDAFARADLGGEIGLLVVAAAIAAFVHRLREEPARAERVVERDHGRVAFEVAKQVEQRLHEVVGLHRASGHADEGDAGVRAERPPEVIGQSHAPRRIAGHGVDAAVRRARARRDDGPRAWREAI